MCNYLCTKINFFLDILGLFCHIHWVTYYVPDIMHILSQPSQQPCKEGFPHLTKEKTDLKRVGGTALTLGSKAYCVSTTTKPDFFSQPSSSYSKPILRETECGSQTASDISPGSKPFLELGRKTTVQERIPSGVVSHFRTQRCSHLPLWWEGSLPGVISSLKTLHRFF